MRAMQRLAIIAVLIIAACAQNASDDAQSICAPLCECAEVPLPAQQDSCNVSCVAQFRIAPPSPACATCITDNIDRCVAMREDCAAVCVQSAPRMFDDNTATSRTEDGQ